MRCQTCPRQPGDRCAGERLTHLCGRLAYQDWLAAEDPGPERGQDPWGGDFVPPAPPSIPPAVRDAVNSCPDRGPEGGLALTADESGGCCGGGAERTECRAGKGANPGRVTLRECLACKAAELG